MFVIAVAFSGEEAWAVVTTVRILGPIEVWDRERRVELGGPRQVSLLALLVLEANRAVTADALIDALWRDGDVSARKRLQMAVRRLRQALEPVSGGGRLVLDTVAGGYLLRLERTELDSELFAAGVAAGRAALRAGECERARECLQQALSLWRGPPLAEVVFEDFAQPEIRRLEELRISALESRIDADLQLGRSGELVSELETLISEDPARERLASQLMTALYRCGRQADALDAYQRTRMHLAQQLGLEPGPALKALQAQILEHDAALGLPPRAAPAPAGNLPVAATPFLGRSRELIEVTTLLQDANTRLVTLTGAGGIGKTRLATAVAAELLDNFPGGVFMVRLAGIRDPGSILPMIAETVGIAGDADEPLESVLALRLGSRPTLLLLDNFEQLVAGASIVGRLIGATDQLRVLVTSQVPLRIGAESVFAVGPLTSDAAATLFIERARVRDREFEPTGEDETAIAAICERVDGMPLAIELAAARAGLLGVRELERRLESPLGVLTRGDRDVPERHQSLRAAIEWTHTLLDTGEKSLFAKLGACAGPVPLGMVDAIAGSDDRSEVTLDCLAALLECSLVRRQQDLRLGVRFLMPQALRAYACERLTDSGLEDDVRYRHAEHVAGLAHAARLWKWGATAEHRSNLLAVSHEIRPALAWARAHDPALHVRLCEALSSYWTYRGVVSEASDELRRALESGAGSAAERARCVTILAKCRQLAGGGYDASELAEQALAAWKQVDDDVERAIGYGDLGWVLRWASRLEDAVPLAEESLAILRRTEDRRLILRALVFLAHAFADLQDVTNTERVLTEAGALAGDDPVWELDAIRADCALYRGDYTRAIDLYAKSLTWTSQTGESHQMLMDLRCLGICLGRAGHAHAALELIELIRLHEQDIGRGGNIAGAVALLNDSHARSLQIAGSEGEREAITRARTVAPSQRVERALQVSAEAVQAAPAQA